MKLFEAENWMFLTMFLGLLPVIAAVLFMTSPMPEMHMEERIPGIGVTSVFPILGALLLLGIIAYFRKTAAQNKTA